MDSDRIESFQHKIDSLQTLARDFLNLNTHFMLSSLSLEIAKLN